MVKEKQKPGIIYMRQKVCLEDEEGLAGFGGEWGILRGKGNSWKCVPRKAQVREELGDNWAFVEAKQVWETDVRVVRGFFNVCDGGIWDFDILLAVMLIYAEAVISL